MPRASAHGCMLIDRRESQLLATPLESLRGREDILLRLSTAPARVRVVAAAGRRVGAAEKSAAVVVPAACRRRSHAGKPRSLAYSSVIASTIGWGQRRSVTAVPWTLIPAPRTTQHEVDAEPSLRAASGSLKSACSHVGWRPAPRLRLAIANRRRNHHQRKRNGHRQNSDHKSKDADHPREPNRSVE